MSEKLVVEGTVTDDETDGPFLHTEPPKGSSQTGYYGGDLLVEFVGKRIRVTIEELVTDEDCPPPTGPDGRRAMPEGGSKDW